MIFSFKLKILFTMLEELFLYKQKIEFMTLKELKQELDRKNKHNKNTGFTLSKIWLLDTKIRLLEEQEQEQEHTQYMNRVKPIFT